MKHSLTILASVVALTLAACGTTQAQGDGVGAAIGANAATQDADDLRAFPAAADGQTRHVIRLPAEADEDALKVEIIVGKTATVDCNRSFFGGALETRTAERWGYDYHVLPTLGAMAGTLMACPANTSREAFVTIRQQPLIRYNSRLPLVVYAPQDVEVRYRLWRAGETRTAP